MGNFISQDKYVDEILKKFGFSTVKTASTPMETLKPLLKDAETEDVDTQKPRKAKRPTEISQSSGPIPLVADETVIKEWEDRMERDATTASSLEAKQDSEAQIRFQAASKQFNDPPLLRVNTLRSGEDNMKLKELMEFCTKLSKRALDL
ncbi:hypothetical protein Tco_0962160 [Tanacetum coccineum]